MHAQLHVLSHWHHLELEKKRKEKEAREREEKARKMLSRKKILLKHVIAHFTAKRHAIKTLAAHHLARR